MTAKQTLSASLVVLLSAPLALAEPDAPQPSGDVQPETTAPGETEPVEPVETEPVEPVPVETKPVETKPVETKPVETKPVELMPKRKPTGTFQVGAGYSSDWGFAAMARIAQDDLFRTGKKLSLTASISEHWQDFRMRFEDPALLGTQLQLSAELFSKRRHYSTFTREGTGGQLTLKRRIAPGLDIYAGYKLEHVKVEHATTVARSLDPMAPIGQPIERPWTGGLIGSVRAGLSYSNTNTHELDYPMRGTTAGASIEIADRDLGSSINYTRTDAYLSHHRPLGPFTLHVGGRVATISESAPMSERLHFDGSRDIRGYAPGELMPTGANMMWTARAELEAPLIPCANLNIAAFFDAGGMYTRELGREAASAGFGLIWRSPIGPLRFDWAYPLDGDGKPRFVFGIGGMF